MDVDTSTIALQASLKENIKLTGIVEDDLARKGQGFGEQDLVHIKGPATPVGL